MDQAVACSKYGAWVRRPSFENVEIHGTAEAVPFVCEFFHSE
jgi:hypothetical protein